MRAHRAVSWVLLASVAAYLVLIVAEPLELIDPVTRLYVGSIAALAIVVSALAFLTIYIVAHNRRGRQVPISAEDGNQKRARS
jgi:polyferredoxin